MCNRTQAPHEKPINLVIVPLSSGQEEPPLFLSSKTVSGLVKRASPSNLASRFEKMAYAYGLRSTASLTLPDFLCIGFRKSGTTWLYENLHFHPEIYLPPYKNVRYFSNDYKQPLASYAEHFKDGRGRVKGDFSNSYSFIDSRRIEFISKVMPRVKLIVLLRNPVEREWSEFVHNVTEAGEKVEGLSEVEVLDRLERSALLKAGGYNAVLDKWLGYFPEDQVYIGLRDEIKREPKRLLGEVFTFLGVSTKVDWSAFPYEAVIVPPVSKEFQLEGYDPWRGVQVENYQSAANDIPAVYRDFLTEKLAPELELLAQRFGRRVAHWQEELGEEEVSDKRVEVTSGAA